MNKSKSQPTKKHVKHILPTWQSRHILNNILVKLENAKNMKYIFIKLEHTKKTFENTQLLMHPSGIHAQHTSKNSNDPRSSEALGLRAHRE